MVSSATSFYCICLVLITPCALGSIPKALHGYEISKKYNCWKKLDLFLDRSLLFSYGDTFLHSWPGFTKFDCQMSVYSRTQNTGIIATVQKLKLRKTSSDTCLDHVKFTKDETLRCGNMLFGFQLQSNGTLPPSTSFVSEFAGPFSLSKQQPVQPSHGQYNQFGHRLPQPQPPSPQTTTTSWPESRQLLSPGSVVETTDHLVMHFHAEEKPLKPGEELELIVAFTAYMACDGFHIPKGMFNCGYGVCILDMYVGDGVVNCPFGDCRDEGDCEEAKIASHRFVNESKNETKEVDFPFPLKSATWRMRDLADQASIQNDMKTLDEMKGIGEEFKKHNRILEGISQNIDAAVVFLQKEKVEETDA